LKGFLIIREVEMDKEKKRKKEVCSWCGSPNVIIEIHKGEERLFLCPTCYEHYRLQYPPSDEYSWWKWKLERGGSLLTFADRLLSMAEELIKLSQFAKIRRIPRDLKRVEGEEEVFLSEEKEKEYLQKAVELPLERKEAIKIARIVQRQREGKKVWCVESEKTGRFQKFQNQPNGL